MTTTTPGGQATAEGATGADVASPLRRASITGRIFLVVAINLAGLVALALVLTGVGGQLRLAWNDLRATNQAVEQLFDIERAAYRLHREARSFLDRPDEERRGEFEAAKAVFTGVLLRAVDGGTPEGRTELAEFADSARRFLFGFDDLRGLEIDIRLLYENEFADLVPRVRERLDALDLAIRPNDVELRPLVAAAYDRFAAFRVDLVAYRQERRSELLDDARRARDGFAAALREIGRSEAPDSRGYAIERFASEVREMDSIFSRLEYIADRRARWLAGAVEGNRVEMTALLQRAVDRQEELESRAIRRFDDLFGAAIWRFAAITAVFAALSLWASIKVARTIRAPLTEARGAMSAVVVGDTDRPVAGLEARDEIGDMARSIEVFRQEVAGIRRREEEHGAQERRWYGILETSPIGIAILSASDGRPVFRNRRYDQLFGLTDDAEASPPRPRDGFADPDDAVRLSEAVGVGRGVSGWQALMRRLDGSTWWGLLEVRPIDFAGRPAHVFWVYDVTDRREAEETMRLAKEGAEAALRELADAQQSLIEAEKLAAIGGLVAGVAHEVNNPVGIGLTVASSLERRVAEFEADLASGSLRRSRLDEFVAGTRDAAGQLVTNLARAGELVQSFKQVAVDRTHAERRSFDLADASEQIASSLRPGLKTTGLVFDLDVPAGIVLDSFPGAWGQVVTNLFVNAVTHAWPAGASGRMTLSARRLAGDRVEVTFADDGAGMSDEVSRRAFEPFFTTRRGSGGSGLGLHIVYNIVTRRLGGRIALETAPGRGCRFRMNLPLSAPDDEGEGERATERMGRS